MTTEQLFPLATRPARRSFLRKVRRVLRRKRRVALTLAALLAPTLGRSAGQTPEEQQQKGALISNLIQFVRWPGTAWSSGDTFSVGIIGDAALSEAIAQATAAESVQGHAVSVRRIDPLKDPAAPCQLLYIADREGASIDLSKLRHAGVLIVTESERLLHAGAMVRFAERDGKLKLQINLHALREASLSINSKLLKLAELVEDPGSGLQPGENKPPVPL